MISEMLTLQYHGATVEHFVASQLLFGNFALTFWATVALFTTGFLILAFYALQPKSFSLKGTVIAATLILTAFWLKRYIIVVPPLLYGHFLPHPTRSYSPTSIE